MAFCVMYTHDKQAPPLPATKIKIWTFLILQQSWSPLAWVKQQCRKMSAKYSGSITINYPISLSVWTVLLVLNGGAAYMIWMKSGFGEAPLAFVSI